MRRFLSLGLALLLVMLLTVPASANGISIQMDGRPFVSDAAPVMENGRVLVPLRALGEALGFRVEYNAGTDEVTLAGGTDVIVMKVGSTTAVVNGTAHNLDVPVTVKDGRTYVPVRFVAEHLGAEVSWDESTQTVAVKSPVADKVLALLNNATAAVASNQKSAGEINMQMTMDINGMKIAMEMPMSMEVHTHEGDMLMRMTMTMPGPLGQSQMETMTALKDGVMYTTDAVNGNWVVLGKASEDGMPDLSGLGLPGLDGLMDLQQDLFKGAKMTYVGKEAVRGFLADRIDVQIDPAALNEMFAGLFGAFGLPEGDSIEMDVKAMDFSLYVDPNTGYALRTEIEMALEMHIKAEGESGSVALNMSGFIDAWPTNQPIEWPELPDPTAVPELPFPMPGMDPGEAEETVDEAEEAVEGAEEAIDEAGDTAGEAEEPAADGQDATETHEHSHDTQD